MSSDPAVLAPAARAAVPHAGALPRVPILVRLVEGVTAYLPVLLMALLALGTWWLVKNTPVAADAAPPAAARQDPDYTMTRFLVQRFAPDGVLRAQIEGDVLRHYPATDIVEVDNARIRVIAVDGHVTLATATRALSNGDGSEVQLRGGAHVVRQPLGQEEAIDFRGEFLHVFVNAERVRSHLPVVVTRGRTELQADTLDYDHLAGLLKLDGRVRATFPPAPPAAAAHR